MFWLINLFFVFLSLHFASQCETWSFGWWFNVFASAMNAAAVMVVLL